MLLLSHLVREFLLSLLLYVSLFEVVLRTFIALFVSQVHFIILGPELLSLLELHARLELGLRLMWLVLPPVLGLFIMSELGQFHAVNTYCDRSKLLGHVFNHVFSATSFNIRLGLS